MIGLDEDVFLGGMREVRALMEELQWAPAKERLLALLGEHRDRDYVRVHMTEIQEDLPGVWPFGDH